MNNTISIPLKARKNPPKSDRGRPRIFINKESLKMLPIYVLNERGEFKQDYFMSHACHAAFDVIPDLSSIQPSVVDIATLAMELKKLRPSAAEISDFSYEIEVSINLLSEIRLQYEARRQGAVFSNKVMMNKFVDVKELVSWIKPSDEKNFLCRIKSESPLLKEFELDVDFDENLKKKSIKVIDLYVKQTGQRRKKRIIGSRGLIRLQILLSFINNQAKLKPQSDYVF